MVSPYSQTGFIHKPSFFSTEQLQAIEPALWQFHENWLADNRAFYQDRAINSAYITGTQYLPEDDRMALFQFIAQDKLMGIARETIGNRPAFMNTQLFFNPANPRQKNYWHRDGQYTDMTVEEQKRSLTETNILHFRIPLKDEPGIELVPGSHKAWDTEEHFNVRMEQNGRKNHEALSDGQAIPLRRGDLLVFSANMIHRGLYGGDRFALDVILSDANKDLLRFVDKNCLPSKEQMGSLKNSDLFEATWTALGQ